MDGAIGEQENGGIRNGASYILHAADADKYPDDRMTQHQFDPFPHLDKGIGCFYLFLFTLSRADAQQRELLARLAVRDRRGHQLCELGETVLDIVRKRRLGRRRRGLPGLVAPVLVTGARGRLGPDVVEALRDAEANCRRHSTAMTAAVLTIST